MVDPIKRILIKHPKDAYKNQSKIDQESPQLNYLDVPDFEKAKTDYDKFVEFLESYDIEIHFLPEKDTTSIDSVYTHDPCVVSNGGVILCTMGKDARVPESKAVEAYFESIGVPILGQIEFPGTLEGGDVVWIDERTVAIGEGYRTHAEGIRPFTALLGQPLNTVNTVPPPHCTGPADCLHLMSNISPIDHDLYLVYSRLLPVSVRQYLLDRQIKLIEVPDEEYESMGCNVLAVAPRKVIMLKGNPITQKRLETKGVDVHTYDGTEISLKGAGGPTCLTRPFLRLAE